MSQYAVLLVHNRPAVVVQLLGHLIGNFEVPGSAPSASGIMYGQMPSSGHNSVTVKKCQLI